ncbi:ABC transporter substrate-binding protein [Bacillus chungangensis]|uniref:Peptide/nickel transport system substrate-binding protein n=1 Tax=Bacillus chungangensis TaxID=587633 RepID=A0ABT9WQV8_9BACI|nr:ABC transporter substrate-binding protein [Bacillus chungangensis]MDQ0175676.1 peptide/nickel transport system substrate-binding protein [Bacillus chungangensis]
MRKQAYTFIFMIFLIVTTACSPETAGTDTSDKKSNNKGAEQANKTDVTIAIEADAGTLLANTDVNYTTDVQIRNIYDPLIDRDPKTGEVIPALATEWENIDEHTWEFTLKEGVSFHNGAPFNAEAVKFSIDFILDEANNSFYRSRWVDVQEVKVIDDYKVQIMTSAPFPSMVQRVAEDLLIMEPGYVKEVGLDEAAKKPIGTGAYKFKEWRRDEHLKLEANEEYWNGKPAIKDVTFRYVPEFGSRLSSFLSGEIDLFKNVPVDSVENIKSNQNAKIESIGSSRVNYVALNNFFNGPLKDKKVRQALNYAVDVDELLETVLNGNGTKMTGPLAKINLEYTETEGYQHDPDKAIALLKEAGYEPEDLNLTLDTPNGRYPMDTQVAQAIAAQLQRIGIKVDVEVNEWGNHLTKIRQREMGDMFILGWGPAFEGQSTIENLFTEAAPYSGFYEPAVEEEIKKAIPLFDPEERKKAFADIQHLLVEEAAWIPLWQQADLYAVHKDLQFHPRVDERIQVFEMKW